MKDTGSFLLSLLVHLAIGWGILVQMSNRVYLLEGGTLPVIQASFVADKYQYKSIEKEIEKELNQEKKRDEEAEKQAKLEEKEKLEEEKKEKAEREKEAELRKAKDEQEKANKEAAEKAEEDRLELVRKEAKEKKKKKEEDRKKEEKKKEDDRKKAEKKKEEDRKKEEKKKKLAELKKKKKAERKVFDKKMKKLRDKAMKKELRDERRRDRKQKAVAARDALHKEMDNEKPAKRAGVKGGSRNATLRGKYITAIQRKIQSNWIKPPSADGPIKCRLRVVQSRGGYVKSVRVTNCNGDALLNSSLETAVRKADPLPYLGFEKVFEGDLNLIYEPKK